MCMAYSEVQVMILQRCLFDCQMLGDEKHLLNTVWTSVVVYAMVKIISGPSRSLARSIIIVGGRGAIFDLLYMQLR